MDKPRVKDRNKRNPNAWGGVTFGLALSLGPTLGLGMGAWYDAIEPSRLTRERAYLAETSGQFDEANRNMSRTEQEIGEACARLARVSLPGGQLATTENDSKVEENQVVADLMGHPTKACGDSPTDVRIAFRNLGRSVMAFGEAQREAQAAKAEVRSLEHGVVDSSIPNGLLAGSLAGLGGGLVLGTGAAWLAKDRNWFDERRAARGL